MYTLLFAFALLFATIKPSFASIPMASIAVDADSGLVIKADNADVQTYPASLTKVMTLYMVFEALEKGWITENDMMKVSYNASSKPSAKLWLKPNSEISVEDGIKAIITRSANDVATVFAEHLGKSEENFAKMMTTVAKELGMSSTTFKNASGLHNSEQKTTARDLAILAMAIMNHFPQYYYLFSTRMFEFNNQKCFNHNRLLRTYSGADGIKTGFVQASGFNLITSAHRGGHRIVAVVLGRNSAKQRDKDMTKLLDKSFMSLIMSPDNIYIPPEKPNIEILNDMENDSIFSLVNKKYNFKKITEN
ncbi:MAG: D-alanyl-D-alanine carboxypeptidase family protein [Alphaproteobacteria bacterium]